MQKLPVDQVMPELLQALAEGNGVVLQAPPGSGKTSRVPLALLDSPLLAEGTVVMLEPRRLAAVNAASWLAKSFGEEVGRRVGYSIRFNTKVSRETLLEVVTEGLLTRRLQSDPALTGVSVVIFDEFHERSLHADTALAFCLDVQRTIRPDLKIVIMSATIDSARIAGLLGGVRVITCGGESHPVEIHYLGEPDRGIVRGACNAVQRAVRETSGDILVFLPGAGEIRRCHDLLREGGSDELLICQLYGDLPFAEQEQAIQPTNRRKVVLATNIAETSLTIEGVGVVIDTGLARRVQYDPGSGLNRMQTVRVSDASATQRTGRAGRQGPGVSYRLWSKGVQATLLPYNPPEIKVVDLAPFALELANWGIIDEKTLSWLDPPALGPLSEARQLLVTLGALDNQGLITYRGRRMADLPLHPRLSRMVLAGEERGSSALACDLAALLGERDIFRRDHAGQRQVSSCDYVDRLEALEEWRSKRNERSPRTLDMHACQVVEQVSKRLRGMIKPQSGMPASMADELGILLAKAFPDRIARQREKGSSRYLLANGTGAELGRHSALHDQPFIVAVEVIGHPGKEGTIHGSTAISLETLRREFIDDILQQRKSVWNKEDGRVSAFLEENLGELVLSSRPVQPVGTEASTALITAIAANYDLADLPWTIAARQFQGRLKFLKAACLEREWPDLSTANLSETLSGWLAPALYGMKSLADLRRLDMLALLKGLCSWEQLRLIEQGAPTHLVVPSGSRVQLEYSDGEPTLSVKLQEMFGLSETPTVAWGRVPVLLHLLSPARRPIQVTSDLLSFWENTYPVVRKELKGRYPKHPWPDDPWSAVPTRWTKKRGSS